MVVGNAIVLGSLVIIAVKRLAFPTVLDGIVWLTALLMILARRLDIVWHQGTTAIDEPATWAHVQRHTATVLLVTAAASVLAHTFFG